MDGFGRVLDFSEYERAELESRGEPRRGRAVRSPGRTPSGRKQRQLAGRRGPGWRAGTVQMSRDVIGVEHGSEHLSGQAEQFRCGPGPALGKPGQYRCVRSQDLCRNVSGALAVERDDIFIRTGLD